MRAGLLMARARDSGRALRQAGPVERLSGSARRPGSSAPHASADHRIAGDQRRHDRVDRRQVRDSSRARSTRTRPSGSRLIMRRKPVLSSSGTIGASASSAMRSHVARPLLDAAELAAIADRAAHLLGELGHDLLVHRAERVEDARSTSATRSSSGTVAPAPSAPRAPRRSAASISAPDAAGGRADDFAAVDGRNADDVGHDVSSNQVA